MSIKPDENNVVIKRWVYLGGGICYNCNWETCITPAPKKCPKCNTPTHSRFTYEWKKESRLGFGLTCPYCKNSNKRRGNRLAKGKNYYRNVSISERLRCRICGKFLTSNVVLT